MRGGDFLLIVIIAVLSIGIVTLFAVGRFQIDNSKEKIEEYNHEAEEQRVEEENAIKEKEANDSFYQKLSDGFDVNILVVGDSIGAGSGSSSIGNAWFNLLKRSLVNDYGIDVDITNVSMGGNTSYAGYARVVSLEDGIDYDLAIICYGQNDSPDNFSLYYESVIRAIKNKYSNCSIISFLESSQREYTEKIKAIQQLADYYGYPVVDTIASFSEEYDSLTDGAVHPNDEGQLIYFENIYEIITESVNVYRGADPTCITPMNPEVQVFDTYKYLPVNEFKRIDNLTYDISLSISGILGIDYTYQSQSIDSKTEIYIDNELFVAPKITFNYDFSQRHILIVSDNCQVENNIRIVFETEDAADGFYGLYFSGIK